MAASFVKAARTVEMDPHVVSQFDLGTLVADALENIAHAGPSGCTVDEARCEVITRPTDGSPVFMEHKTASDSTTNDTVALRFYTVAGGSLDGAVVRVKCKFNAMSSNSITATV